MITNGKISDYFICMIIKLTTKEPKPLFPCNGQTFKNLHLIMTLFLRNGKLKSENIFSKVNARYLSDV